VKRLSTELHYILQGDFRLPAIDELIGPEAREFTYYYSPVSTKYQSTPVFPADSPTGVFGYAPYMETATLDQSVDSACLYA